jgi:integrase
MKIPKATKLPSGKWRIQLRLGGESYSVTEDTLRGAQRRAERIKAEYRVTTLQKEKALRNDSKGITVKEAIERYIKERENVLSPVTVRAYEIMRRRLEPYGERELATMRREDWQAMLNELAAKYKPKTLKNTVVFLRSAVENAGGSIPKLELPQAAPKSIPFLRADEIEPFVKAVALTDIAVPALLGLSSLRLSEIRGLRWENIAKRADFIRVENVMVLDASNTYVPKNHAKNVSSARNVPILIPELREAIERERKPSGAVLTITDKALRCRLAKVCREAGIMVVSIHGLRHSFASLCYHLGVPELIAMEMGGWSNPGTMRRIYTHIAQSDIERYKGELAAFYDKNAHKNAHEGGNA